MGKKNLTFVYIEIEKNKFYRNKTLISLKDINIQKILVSNNISFGEKNYRYFIGYLYKDHKVKPLHIMLPKTSAYVKSYDGQSKWMNYLLIEDGGLIDKYNNIWDKVSADMKKEFDNKSVYNREFLKTKIKSHGDEVPDFHDQKIFKTYSNHTCLAVISLDSSLQKDENYYPQVFLKEF